MPKNGIHHIVKGTRGITADKDLRLCRFFGLSEGYWLRLRRLLVDFVPPTVLDKAITHIARIAPSRERIIGNLPDLLFHEVLVLPEENGQVIFAGSALGLFSRMVAAPFPKR